MIRRYLNHMQEKTAHERRQHAVQIASVITALVFVGWLGTLGLRLSAIFATASATAEQRTAASTPDTSGGETQLAGAGAALPEVYTAPGSNNGLMVATTSVYSAQ